MKNNKQHIIDLKAGYYWQRHLTALKNGDEIKAKEWLDKIDELK